MLRRLAPCMLLTACGGSPDKPADSPPPKQSQPQSQTSGEKQPDYEVRTLVYQGCMSQEPDSEPLCACLGDEASKLYDPKTPKDPEHMKPLYDAAVRACTPPLTKVLVGQCTGGDPEAETYCECFVGQMLTKHTVVEMHRADVRDSLAFTEEKMDAAKACDAKMPPGKVEREFLAQCEKKSSLSFCKCAYAEFTRTLTPAELTIGDARASRFDGARKAVAKACAVKN